MSYIPLSGVEVPAKRVIGMILEQVSDRSRAQLASGVVAYALGFDLTDMLGQARGRRHHCLGRQLSMYLTYTAFEMSLSRCAYAFGRDRSTVAHACHTVEARRDDAAFDNWVDGLESSLKTLAPYAPDGKAAL